MFYMRFSLLVSVIVSQGEVAVHVLTVRTSTGVTQLTNVMVSLICYYEIEILKPYFLRICIALYKQSNKNYSQAHMIKSASLGWGHGAE